MRVIPVMHGKIACLTTGMCFMVWEVFRGVAMGSILTVDAPRDPRSGLPPYIRGTGNEVEVKDLLWPGHYQPSPNPNPRAEQPSGATRGATRGSLTLTLILRSKPRSNPPENNPSVRRLSRRPQTSHPPRGRYIPPLSRQPPCHLCAVVQPEGGYTHEPKGGGAG